MIRPVLIFLFSLFALTAVGQKKLSGEYKTNISAYGMFGKTLILKCDSTVILNFKGDMMNDNSYGRWKVTKKIVTLVFDTTKAVKSRYKEIIRFRVKSKKLYEIGLTKEDYKKIKIAVSQEGKEMVKNTKLLSFKQLARQQNQVMKNYKGAMGKQFFRRIKTYSCSKSLPGKS